MDQPSPTPTVLLILIQPLCSSWVVPPPCWTAMGGTQAPPPPELAAAHPDGWSLVVLVDG